MNGNQRFSITPSSAVDDKNLSDSVFRTLSCLGVYGDKNGWCWPSLTTLAEMRGVSKERISADIKILVQRGYVQRQARFQDGSQITNMYRVLFDTPTPPLTPEVNPPLTTEINPPLTPEVNQNAPFNAPFNDINNGDPIAQKLSELKCRFNPNSAVIIKGWKSDFPDNIILRAIQEAANRNKVSMPYIDQIIITWKANGVPPTREQRVESAMGQRRGTGTRTAYAENAFQKLQQIAASDPAGASDYTA